MAAPMASPLTAVARAARLHPVSCSASSSSPKNPKQSSSSSSSSPPAVPSLRSAAVALAGAVPLLAALPPPDALAVGGELGIIEGRTVALLHPAIMGGLFAYTLWAGYLGWQWRRVRTVQDEITELKKQVRPAAAAATPAAVGAGDSASPPPPPAAKSPTEIKIEELSEERKKLVKGGFRDRHFNAGSILLGLGVTESVGGALNTWLRTGKLFPGPHLFAGAAITVLWAAAAALVPAMQKGNETARSLHIALNTINVLLFIWQIPTGLEIVGKVFEFTNWP
ncbi:hypothetical protein CFC21_086665 [Triticum aestivum]|uniref:Uncharacterized protein n=3 Tax=Triticum TaxID=4564 RepID=A0A9R1B758_TRITD|nr:uncharacterized protein LOC119324859 [Triticum dicoccoides]XP_044411011.1 uncharacterized protein LOC123135847 [Triticum aestivum]KAF7082816.1 hypothetical protein CFC21_086665 [Triticum aestivum]VAI54006.1 unnamed protein product [Triticum turgidum subsp. durum]